MKRLIASALFVVVLGCEDEPPPAPTSPIESRVELAAGNVWLVQAKEKERLVSGAMLEEGARIQVGSGGRALIRLSNGTRIFFRSETEATIRGESFELTDGEVFADVAAGDGALMRFTTGDVSVSAEDAGFDLARDRGKVKLYVVRGSAVYSSKAGRMEVDKGEMAVSEGGGMPAVEPVAFFEDWTGGMADRELDASLSGRGAGQIYGIDPTNPGLPPKPLQVLAQSVRTVIRDGIAYTTVDQRFFNPGDEPLEGWYWFTIPEGASVERFALEMNGTLVEGEMIERKQAAEAYTEAVRRAVDPALLEWVDGRSFRARIYPIPGAGERRTVLSYTEILPLSDGVYRYVYPMGSNRDVEIGEFSLEVDLGEEGEKSEIAALQDACIEKNGALVTMRRSGYVPRADFLLEMRKKEAPSPMRIARFSPSKNEADYLMIRYSPDVEWNRVKEVRGDVVVVLDTSAGGDASERQIRLDAVEAVLRALSSSDRFAVVAADLAPRVVYPDKGLAPAEETRVAEAMERLSEISSGGATDLGEMFHSAFDLVHNAVQPAVVYVGDGRATTGETSNLELTSRFRRSMGDSRARLFTMAVGEDANHGLLSRLAGIGGGQSFRIDTAEETVTKALAFVGAVKTPTITDLSVDAGAGLDQVFVTAFGKISKGGEAVLLARTHHALPNRIAVKGRLGGQVFEKSYDTDEAAGNDCGYIARLWARLYLDYLLGDGLKENRGSIISLGLKYALMTPLTSFLVLDGESTMDRRNARSTDKDNHFAIKGPPAGPDPHMARSSSTETGRTDPENALGVLTGGASNTDEYGYGGLGLRGTARGGGGTGEGTIGLENLGTIGHGSGGGSGSGYGRGAGGLGGRRGTSPSIRSGAALVKGSLSKEVIRRIVHRHINEVKFCYERESARKPDLRGRVTIKFIISGTGAVQMSAVADSTLGDPAAENCIAQAVRRWTFPEPMGGGIVIVTYPFQLEPGEGHLQEAPAEPSSASHLTLPAVEPPALCSDASTRPLHERRVVWQSRIARASGVERLEAVFLDARRHCELKRWSDTRALLNLIEHQVTDASEVTALLASFEAHSSALEYLRKQILHRAFDPDVVLSLYRSGEFDWSTVIQGLAALKTDDARITEIRKILGSRPSDPAGRALLTRTLFEAGRHPEALAEALSLKRDGMTTPAVLEILCDLEAAAGREWEAKRICSELVEFNDQDTVARMRLGDVFLRHGWYSAAYRQFKTLLEIEGENPLSILKLARAAAGMGRIDEALRMERTVASGEGEPGPGDIRQWAEMHSAVLIAAMLLDAEARSEDEKIRTLNRALKRIQALPEKAVFKILVWEDEDASLKVFATVKGVKIPLSQSVEANPLGLHMIDLGPKIPENASFEIALAGTSLVRAVPFTIYTVSFDGKSYSVEKTKGKLAPRSRRTRLSAA